MCLLNENGEFLAGRFASGPATHSEMEERMGRILVRMQISGQQSVLHGQRCRRFVDIIVDVVDADRCDRGVSVAQFGIRRRADRHPPGTRRRRIVFLPQQTRSIRGRIVSSASRRWRLQQLLLLQTDQVVALRQLKLLHQLLLLSR